MLKESSPNYAKSSRTGKSQHSQGGTSAEELRPDDQSTIWGQADAQESEGKSLPRGVPGGQAQHRLRQSAPSWSRDVQGEAHDESTVTERGPHLYSKADRVWEAGLGSSPEWTAV